MTFNFSGLPLRKLFVVILSLFVGSGIHAQSTIAPSMADPPSYRHIDGNGVDIGSGDYMGGRQSFAIGDPKHGGMAWTGRFMGRSNSPAGGLPLLGIGYNGDNYKGYIRQTPSITGAPYSYGVVVVIGDQSESFSCNIGGALPACTQFGVPDGSTLTFGPDPYQSNSGAWVFAERDGTTAYFVNGGNPSSGGWPPSYQSGVYLMVNNISRPNGEVLTYTYNSGTISSVVNNFGYMIKYNYLANNVWQFVGINLSVEYCSPSATSCTLQNPWPSLTYTSTASGASVTDSANLTTTYTQTADGSFDVLTTTITKPSGKTIYLTFDTTYDIANQSNCPIIPTGFGSGQEVPYCNTQRVASINDGLNTWRYSYSFAAQNAGNGWWYSMTTTATDPLNNSETSVAWYGGQLQSYRDQLGRTTTVNSVSPGNLNMGQINSIVRPEGDTTTYTYDPYDSSGASNAIGGRGNVSTVTRSPVSGSPLANLVTSYVYPQSCSASGVNRKTCNFPTTVTDPNLNVTSFTYDTNSGGVATMTKPSVPVLVGGVQTQAQPQTRYNYQTYTGKVLSGGSLTPQSSSVYLLLNSSTCQTQSSCAATSDEIKTTYGYDPNNLLPTTTTIASGDGALSALTTLGYDAGGIGNVTSVTDPLFHVSNQTYDADRRPVFAIAPDPGNGIRLAVKTTYDPDGPVYEIDKGSTTTATASNFSPIESTNNLFDAAGRKIQTTVYANGTASGTPLAVTQFSYDVDGRLQCTAVRENQTVFASLPGLACSQSTNGTYGSDRITQYVYDAASQKTQELRGVGSIRQITYGTWTYGADGEKATEKDANGNLSNDTYDGFVRLSQLNYPSISVGAGTYNASDYEHYDYDNNGNMLHKRRRDGVTITYSYDALNRLATKAIPSMRTVYASYNLQGWMSAQTFDSPTGQGVTYGSYNALGYTSSETTNFGSFSKNLGYIWDNNGNRTKITWPDSLSVTYNYDGASRLSGVLENNSFNLVSVGHDALGRLQSFSDGNGAATTLNNYDALDRLGGISQSFPGSTSNNVTDSYSYSPASQIVGDSASISLYHLLPSAQAQATKSFDGLNRDAALVAVSGYDARGNLTYDKTRTFTYDTENRLLSESGPVAATLSYDPLGRLEQTVISGTTTNFLYSGTNLLAELDGSGNILRRYVPGPGTDRPLVWYEGAGTTDRRWLHADRHGSIIATSNGVGGTSAAYAYGAYGEPQSWGGSRYRYTGQIELPELQLYYYKARVYDPIAGRFLQTDPIGSGDDLDLYAYVGDDPTDKSDPMGNDAWQVALGVGEVIVGGGISAVSSVAGGAGALVTAGTGGVALPVTGPEMAVSAVGFTLGAGIAGKGINDVVQGFTTTDPKGPTINEARGPTPSEPVPTAEGEHSVPRPNIGDGPAKGYTTYEPNAKNPTGFQEKKRVDVTGKSHTNPDGSKVDTPHVHEPGKPVRPAEPSELPKP